MQQFIIRVEHLHPERIVCFLVWTLLFVAAGVYAYSIVLSVTNVVLRQELSVAIERTEARIGQLETEYLVRVNALTTEVAYERGFVAVAPKAYVQVGSDDRLTQATY